MNKVWAQRWIKLFDGHTDHGLAVDGGRLAKL